MKYVGESIERSHCLLDLYQFLYAIRRITVLYTIMKFHLYFDESLSQFIRRYGASYGALSGRSARTPSRRAGTGTDGRRCAYGSGESARPSGRTSSRSPSSCTGTASHPCACADAPSGATIWCTSCCTRGENTCALLLSFYSNFSDVEAWLEAVARKFLVRVAEVWGF
jgi:hypothetical protein